MFLLRFYTASRRTSLCVSYEVSTLMSNCRYRAALVDTFCFLVQPGVLKEKETIIIRLQNTIRDLEAQLAGKGGLMREKETLVIRIKELENMLAQKDAEIGRLNGTIADLRARIKELEDLLIKARSEVREIHVAPAPPKEEMRWYYAVQDPAHAQLFQAVCWCFRCKLAEFLRGLCSAHFFSHSIPDIWEVKSWLTPWRERQSSTLSTTPSLNKSQEMPGCVSEYVASFLVTRVFPWCMLRVLFVAFVSKQLLIPPAMCTAFQVVEAQGVQIQRPGVELFVRLRLGSATQFTHPRPVAFPSVSWQQDFVFVGVPLKPHPYHPRYQASTYPLIIEVCAVRVPCVSCEWMLCTDGVCAVEVAPCGS